MVKRHAEDPKVIKSDIGNMASMCQIGWFICSLSTKA